MNCDVCGNRTRLNWGNAAKTLCEAHFESGFSDDRSIGTQARLVLPTVGIVVILIAHFAAFANVLRSCLLLAIVLIGAPLIWIIIPILIYWMVKLIQSIIGSPSAVTSVLMLDFIYIFAYLSLQGTSFVWPQIDIMSFSIHVPSVLLVFSFYYTLNPAYERPQSKVA